MSQTERTLRVVVIAPSMRILGGQAIQANRLFNHLIAAPDIDAGFIAHNPLLPRGLAWLQRIRYVRSVANTLTFVLSLLVKVPRYDVLHIFSASYWSYLLGPMFAVLVGRLYGKQVVLNYRSGELEDHLSKWGPVATRSMSLATIIVSPTPYLQHVFNNFGLKSRVIPNYIDVQNIAFRIRDPLRPSFLINRLFEPLYNYRCSLTAFGLIQEWVPEAHLVVAGYGPLHGQIMEWIKELKLRNVDFRGRVSPSEMRQLYQEVDIYLNSPDLDCFPSSILDAFAAGVPVVTTNAGGIRYIVDHLRTGWMVECGDSEGLAKGAINLLNDESLARQFAQNARVELEDHYVWEVVGPKWETTYRELCKRR